MKKLFLLFISLLLFSSYALSQTILNGSFENNNTLQCLYNITNSEYNATMDNSIGFGPAEQLDILGTACSFGSPQDGDWFVGVSVGQDTLNDALSLELSSPLVVGTTYNLTYYDKKSGSFDTNVLEIGISTQADDFGNLIYTSPLSTTTWTEREVTFTANIAANHITIQAVPEVYGWTHIDNFSISPTTSVKNEQTITDFFVTQNYPNPFNPNTKIKYSIPQLSNVVIKVFDILGNEIETLLNEEKQIGTYEITWYAEELPSGVYFYQLKAGDFIQTKKMILMK
jgi:hypothetical protein